MKYFSFGIQSGLAHKAQSFKALRLSLAPPYSTFLPQDVFVFRTFFRCNSLYFPEQSVFAN